MYMTKFFILWASILLIGFSGCSVKTYQTNETKIITFKTPKMRFNDLGYIRSSDNEIQVDLFSAGQAVKRFEIGMLICLTEGCISKSAFNEDYLNEAYPDDTMQNILLGEKIFEGRDLIKNDLGFGQYIRDEKYDITYRVTADEIYFKDKVNSILIRIRSIKK